MDTAFVTRAAEALRPQRTPRAVLRTRIEKKAGRQVDHIVVNPRDSAVTTGGLSEQLKTWPIQGLKEAIAGTVVRLFP
ncbi:hypothetical protein [Amycolatopsis orientalis]|uniref:hypothetical protein n=1 Tax=Amycolatopsis orientalis TaxID=31958 RepID=UPI00131A1FFF|nr:hypothetical protein [Amycolatopsis orientalis]